MQMWCTTCGKQRSEVPAGAAVPTCTCGGKAWQSWPPTWWPKTFGGGEATFRSS